MTDKEKFRKEVERLKSNLVYGACSSQVAMETRCKEEAYNEVLAILDSLQEEPVSGLDNGDMPIERWKQAVKAASNQRNYRSSKGLTETRDDYFVDGVQWADEHPKKEHVSKELEKAEKEWLKPQLDKSYESYGESMMMELTHFDGYAMLDAIEFGAKWQKENLWKPADGDDLPEIDREVIALLDNGKVVFAHRPPEYWDGKNIVTGKVTRNYPKTYDKCGWNIPDVKWWLDCLIPKEIEL